MHTSLLQSTHLHLHQWCSPPFQLQPRLPSFSHEVLVRFYMCRAVPKLTSPQSNVLPPSSAPDTPSRPPPRPYEQRAYLQQPSYQQQILPTPPMIPSQYKAHPRRHLPTIDPSLTSRRTEPLPSAYMGTVTQWPPTPTPSAHAFPQIYAGEQSQDDFITSAALSPSRTWPTPLHDQLQVPRGNNRERSNSQPAYSSNARTPSGGQLKRRSASNLSDRPGGLQQGFR